MVRLVLLKDQSIRRSIYYSIALVLSEQAQFTTFPTAVEVNLTDPIYPPRV